MKVTQYIPSFIEVEQAPFAGELGCWADLASQGWVQNFWAAPGFSHFSRTPACERGFLLMAEFDGGSHFYVVARLAGPDVEHLTRALPPWQGPPGAAKASITQLPPLELGAVLRPLSPLEDLLGEMRS